MSAVELPYTGPAQKRRMLHWAAQYPYCTFLDSCGTQVDQYGEYEFILGVGGADAPRWESLTALEKAFQTDPNLWAFGVLSYDLKNEIEAKLETNTPAAIPFPAMHFFAAEIVISKRRDSDVIRCEKGGWGGCLTAIEGQEDLPTSGVRGFSGFRSNFSRQNYLETIERLRDHIREGDCYEINLAQNFTAKVTMASPAALWEELKALSPVPFAGYARWESLHLLCASPERFLRLKGDQLLTQPIKGTAARGEKLSDDLARMRRLKTSPKEQAENVMIVDLSRNDLYRSCEVNSVHVPDLFEVQTFPQVHHLVSTIIGQKRADVHPAEVIRQTFPPGSMTGAPKFRTCELIEQYEGVARGMYAGSLGYFSPGADFDLNVIIRSLVYDQAAQRISYHVGGAITWDSQPEAEFEETLVKAKAIGELFKGK